VGKGYKAFVCTIQQAVPCHTDQPAAAVKCTLFLHRGLLAKATPITQPIRCHLVSQCLNRFLAGCIWEGMHPPVVCGVLCTWPVP
jgi:hypothetical protein